MLQKSRKAIEAAARRVAVNAYPTPDWHPLGYHGVYTNFTGRIVNFYNPQDPVLAVWKTDQKLVKPSGGYSYDGTTGRRIEPWPVYTVTDTHEFRAMISRSRTLPIGQSGPEAGHGVLQLGRNLNVRYGFADNFPEDHSAQWAWPIHTTRPYFQELLTSCQILPAP